MAQRTALYTWTDAFGVVLLVSLYEELGKPRFLDEAEWVVSDVGAPAPARHPHRRSAGPRQAILSRDVALRSPRTGAPCARLSTQGVDLVHQIHPAFVVPGRGVGWSSHLPGYLIRGFRN
jgi:hypothetical protein